MKRLRFWSRVAIVSTSVALAGWFNSTMEFGQRGAQLGGIQQVSGTYLIAFYVRSYGGKCLDFGAAPANSSPAFIYDCNGTAAQQVSVEELTGPGHRFVLRAGALVIGAKAPPAKFNFSDSAGGTITSTLNSSFRDQAPLELQSYNGTDGQVFVFDGDSIILAADHNLGRSAKQPWRKPDAPRLRPPRP